MTGERPGSWAKTRAVTPRPRGRGDRAKGGTAGEVAGEVGSPGPESLRDDARPCHRTGPTGSRVYERPFPSSLPTQAWFPVPHPGAGGYPKTAVAYGRRQARRQLHKAYSNSGLQPGPLPAMRLGHPGSERQKGCHQCPRHRDSATGTGADSTAPPSHSQPRLLTPAQVFTTPLWRSL